MNSPPSLGTAAHPVFVAGIILVTTAVLAIALSMIATPRTAKIRVESLQSTVRSIQARRHEINSRSQPLGWSTCANPAATEVVRFNSNLVRLAKARGVTVSQSATTVARDQKADRVDLQLSASGGYPAIRGLLQDLGEAKPTLFTKAVDLRPRAGQVQLEFTGSFWCTE